MIRPLPVALCLLAFTMAAPMTAVAGDIACSKQTKLKSQNSKTPAKMTFVNKTKAARVILWINFNGQPEQFSIIGPREKFEVDTFLTHPWLITDGPGNCIDIFLPAGKKRTVNLTRAPVFGDE